MNFFTKKNFLYKLIICVCIILAVVNCSGIQKVYAAGEESKIGGLLINPICDLLLGLSDSIMNVIQNSVMGTDATLALDNTKKIDWGAVALWVVVIALAVVVTMITAGGALAGLAAIGVAAAKAALLYGAVCIVTGGGVNTVVSAVASEALSDTVVLPTYTIGPEEIFSGRILLFDANVFKPKQVYVEYENTSTSATGTMTLEQWKDNTNLEIQPTKFYYNEGNQQIATSVNNSSYELRETITKWYYIIRNIAIVGSMLILLYIGIRIMISSIAEEKAKYKQMLGDWLIAVCLIFLMHYIMIFSHNIVESITKVFVNISGDGMHVAVIDSPNKTLMEGVQEIGEGYVYKDDTLITGDDVSDGNNIKWPTNLMGRFRVEAQEQDGTVEYVGYTLAYMALVLFTLVFAFTYIKRLLYLLFLTVIAPLVALTYPIDKLHDGKAQAFDMWLKEYIYNLLIQPFHLLLYTIFVAMAFDLASTNIIYTLVVLGFMIPAEKFLRTMFGFNKASSPGLLGGAAGAALAMGAVKSLGNFAKGGSGKNGGNGSGGHDQEKNKNDVRTADSRHSQQSLFEDVASENGGESTGEGMPLPSGTEESPSAQQMMRDNGYEQDETFESSETGTASDAGTTTQEAEPKKDPNGKNMGRAIWGVAKRTGMSALKYTAKAGANLALKSAGAVAGGMVGLATGIVSGDPSKAFQNATAGAGVGIAVGSGIYNRANNAIKGTVDSYKRDKEAFEKDYYGSEYSAHLRAEQDAAFMKDKEKQKLYKQQLGLRNKEEVKAAMEQAVKYREYGINDDNVIIKAMKADKGNAQNRADSRRIAAAKIAEGAKTQKDIETYMKRFAKTKGIKPSQVQDMEKLVREINNL